MRFVLKITDKKIKKLIKESIEKNLFIKESFLNGAASIYDLVLKYGKELVDLAKKVYSDPDLLDDMIAFTQENYPHLLEDPESSVIIKESLILDTGFALFKTIVGLLSIPAIFGFVKIKAQIGPKKTIEVISPRGSLVGSQFIVDINSPDNITWPDNQTTQPGSKIQNKKAGFVVDEKGKYHIQVSKEFMTDPQFERPLGAYGGNVYKQKAGKYYARVTYAREGFSQQAAGATAQPVAGHFFVDWLRENGYNINEGEYTIIVAGTGTGQGNIEDCEVHFNLKNDIHPVGMPKLSKNAIFKIEVKNTKVSWTSGTQQKFDIGMVFSDDLTRVKVLHGMDTSAKDLKYQNDFILGLPGFAQGSWVDVQSHRYNNITGAADHAVPEHVRLGNPIAQGFGSYAARHTQPSQASMQQWMPASRPATPQESDYEKITRLTLAKLLHTSSFKDHNGNAFSSYKVPDIVAYLKILNSSILGGGPVFAFHADQGKLRGGSPMLITDVEMIKQLYLPGFDAIIENYKKYLTAVKNNEPYVSAPGIALTDSDPVDVAARSMALKHAKEWPHNQYHQGVVGTGQPFQTGIQRQTYSVYPVGALVRIIYKDPVKAQLNFIVGKVTSSDRHTEKMDVKFATPMITPNHVKPGGKFRYDQLKEIKKPQYDKLKKKMIEYYKGI